MARITRQLSAVAIAALAMTAAGTAAPAPSEASPLSAIPATAPIVVSVRGVEGTGNRVLAMLKEALPEWSSLVDGYFKKLLAGEFTEGRRLRGVPKDGPIFLIFTEFPKPEGEPHIAFVLAVNKYQEFRDNLLSEDERKTLKAESPGIEAATIVSGETLYFVDKKEFAVVTPDREVATSFTKKHKGIEEVISKTQAAKLISADIAAYVNMETLNKAFGEQIKQTQSAAHDNLKALKENVDKSQRGSFAILEKALDPSFQAVQDSRGVVFSAEFRPGGLTLHLETELQPGTPTAKALEGTKRSDFKGLDSLPAGQMVYSGLEINKSLMETFSEILFAVSSPDEDEKAAKAARKVIDGLLKADQTTTLNTFDLPPAGIQVIRFASPAEGAAANLELLTGLGSGSSYSFGLLKEKPKITPKAEKLGDIEFTRVDLTWDPEKLAENAGARMADDAKKHFTEAFKKLMGDKQTIWIGHDNQFAYIVIAKDWAGAKKLLENRARGENASGSVAAYRDVRKQLPAETSFLGMVDLVRYTGALLDAFKSSIEGSLPIPVKLPSAPAKVPPTYCGGAVTLHADRASVDIVISSATVHEMYKAYIAPLIPGFGAAN